MLKNSEIQLMEKMYSLIIANKDVIFDSNTTGDNPYRIDSNSGISESDVVSFDILIRQEQKVKQDACKRVKEYNKEHPDLHRERNKKCPSYKEKHKSRRKSNKKVGSKHEKSR